MQNSFKFLLASLACLFTSSCGDVWLGDEKKLNLLGERESLVAKSNDLQISHNAQRIKISKPQAISSWTISNASSSQVSSNLQIDNINHEYLEKIGFSTSERISVSSEPIIDQDTIYIIDSDGIINATKTNGSSVWQNDFFLTINKKSFFDFFTSNFVSGGLSKYDGTIYATGGYNVVVALDGNSGDLIWEAKLSSPTRSAPIKISNGNILVQTIDNKVFCLDNKTGEIIWAHFGIADDLSILSGFSLDEKNDKIAFQYSTGEIFVIHAASGEDIWSDSVSSPLDSAYTEGSLMRVSSAPIIVGNLLISYGGDGYAAAFDLETGKNIWKKEFNISKPFWVSGNTFFAISKNHMLFAANVKSGEIVWIHNLSEFIKDDAKRINWSSPIVINNNVFTISSQGKGVMIDSYSGSLDKTIELPDDVYSKPIALKDGLYITSNDGYIYKY